LYRSDQNFQKIRIFFRDHVQKFSDGGSHEGNVLSLNFHGTEFQVGKNGKPNKALVRWGKVRREKGEGRREKGEGRREKGEGRREKGDGDGRREKGEGRRRREKGEGRREGRGRR
jgi:hypothetical protein